MMIHLLWSRQDRSTPHGFVSIPVASIHRPQVYFLDFWAFQTLGQGPPLKVVYEALWDLEAGDEVSKPSQAEGEEEGTATVDDDDLEFGDDDEEFIEQGEDREKEEAALAAPSATTTTTRMPMCTGNMLELASEGEWEKVDGGLRWVHPGVPCVTPIS